MLIIMHDSIQFCKIYLKSKNEIPQYIKVFVLEAETSKTSQNIKKYVVIIQENIYKQNMRCRV